MADNTCNYLLDEYPLLVSPMLAKTIGLNEAVFLQCLHNQLKSRSQEQGGVKWYRCTLKEWSDHLPFWSERKLRRVIQRLIKTRLVRTTRDSGNPLDRTMLYSIDYPKLFALVDGRRVLL